MLVPNIEFKSVLQPIKDINKRNAIFHAMDKQSQRLEIAWDLVCLIQSGVLRGHEHGYWNDSLYEIAEASNGDTTRFQKRLCSIDHSDFCEACARGGIMLSLIRLGSKIGANDYQEYAAGEGVKHLPFTRQNFLEIEKCYENFIEYDIVNTFPYENYPYPPQSTERLLNIMCNILVNGKFKESDFTNYLIEQ